MSNDKAGSVKLHFANNELTLSSNTPEVGEANEKLAVSYDGEELAISFNPTFIIDALRGLGTKEVVFEFGDERSPVVVRISDHPDFLCVVMPMRG